MARIEYDTIRHEFRTIKTNIFRCTRNVVVDARERARIHTAKVNSGPQHPSAHGVPRIRPELAGETSAAVRPHIGPPHRGTEKLSEMKTVVQVLPYMDRLDHVPMAVQEHVSAMAAEKIMNQPVTIRIQDIRASTSELTRILNHLLAITTHAPDVGASTPFSWLFEEREYLLSFHEEISGARMHSAYLPPTEPRKDISLKILPDIYSSCPRLTSRIDESTVLLTNNPAWKKRLEDVGVVSLVQAVA